MDKRRDDQQEEIDEVEEESLGEKDLQSELEAMTQLAQQFENQVKRLSADYQNLQRRVQEEKAGWIRMANKDLLLKLLPVLDTLILAQKHLSDKGLELSINQFLHVLQAEGVERIETKDKEFDAQTMEAIGTAEVDKKQGKVVEEVRVGFMYYDAVLRPAQVIV